MSKAKQRPDSLIMAENGIRIGVVALAYILFSAIIFHLLEGWDLLDSTYFVVVTLSTVGYGDISPQTQGGKLFAIIFIILGIVIFSSLITSLATKARKRREDRIASRKR